MSDEAGDAATDAGTAKDQMALWPDDASGWLRILDESQGAGRRGAAEWLATRGLAADRVVPILADLVRREFADGEPSHYDAEMWLGDKIRLLRNYGPDAAPAVPVLIEALEHRNPQMKADAAVVLAGIGPSTSSAVPALREALVGFDPSARRMLRKDLRLAEALWVLARDPKAVEIVLEIFRGDPDGNHGVIETLGRIGTDSPAVITALVNALRAEGPHFHLAMSALEAIGPPARDAVPILAEVLLAGEEIWGRMHAARALWRITGEAGPSVAALVAALDDPNERVGRWAALSLGWMGPAATAALPALRRKLDRAEGESEESCLRPVPRKLRFAEALGVIEGRLPIWRLDFTDDLKLLLDELDGPDEARRRWAAELIAQMGPEAWPAIPALRRERTRAEGDYEDLLGVRHPAREPFERALAAFEEMKFELDDSQDGDERGTADG